MGECATQRYLDSAGRAQARRMGDEFKRRGIEVGKVLSSQWCWAVDTATEAFGRPPITEPAFNSFFNDKGVAQEQTAKARAILLSWKGPGTLVVISHQANITALTEIFPKSGEGLVVVGRNAQKLGMIGRITP